MEAIYLQCTNIYKRLSYCVPMYSTTYPTTPCCSQHCTVININILNLKLLLILLLIWNDFIYTQAEFDLKLNVSNLEPFKFFKFKNLLSGIHGHVDGCSCCYSTFCCHLCAPSSGVASSVIKGTFKLLTTRKSQNKGKESENSYQKLKRSSRDRHTKTHE